MWKIAVAFVVLAVVVVWVLTRRGAGADMSGEKHGVESGQAAPEGPASATLPPVPAASQ